jgi:hypothetical protein
MINSIFKKSILISILGHLTIFSIFSFSFGNRLLKIDYTRVNFWGALLSSTDLIGSRNFNLSREKKEIFLRRPDIRLSERINKPQHLISDYHLKPAVNLALSRDKLPYLQKLSTIAFTQKKKAPVIMFYPHLPYHFLLYFKDRQTVHIELMFNIVSQERTNAIIIKRKISSGNLEADLLAMRYISHYLFIQQASFPINSWQTVKIDLSAKSE